MGGEVRAGTASGNGGGADRRSPGRAADGCSGS